MQSSDSELVDSGRRASMWLSGLALTACPVTLATSPSAPLRLEPCARAAAALLRATGHELSDAQTVTRSWWGLGALARLSLRAARDLAIELEGGALVPLVDRRFVVLPSGASLARTPTLAPFASAGLAYAL
jgi:hypothetical protein